MTPLQPGDMRLAHVPSPWSPPEHAHKRRPVVLVGPMDGMWGVATLTKLTHFKDRTPRAAIPGWEAAGLDAQPYLWSERVMKIPAGNIEPDRMGRAPLEMVEALTRLLGLTSGQVESMLADP